MDCILGPLFELAVAALVLWALWQLLALFAPQLFAPGPAATIFTVIRILVTLAICIWALYLVFDLVSCIGHPALPHRG